MTIEVVTRGEAHARHAAAHGFGSAQWTALGTWAHVLVAEPARLTPARRAVEELLDRVDHAASRFRADSELTAVNRAEGRWTPVSPLLQRALRVALDAAAWTDGLVDPTVGGTLVALGYDRTFRLLPRDGGALPLRVRPVPGWRRVELDDAAGRVRVPAGTVLDLGATAKGLAADLAAAAAAAAAGCGVLVSLGGDVAVAGEPPAGGWPVAVADSGDPAAPVVAGPGHTVALTAGGLATSSVTARRWRRGGSVLHHLVDPRLGRPAEAPWRTVSVTAATCVLANTASTAAMIIGAPAASWLGSRGFAARLVDRAGAVTAVGGWPAAEGAPC